MDNEKMRRIIGVVALGLGIFMLATQRVSVPTIIGVMLTWFGIAMEVRK